MVKKASEAEILEELYDLILSKTLNSKEREVLVKSKNNLEKGNYTPKVINDLQHSLAPLASKQELPSEAMRFYIQLSQQFIERGQRGSWLSF